MIVPDSFVCPITATIMEDPVVDPEGHSYEREAISEWLQSNSHSPITRKPLRLEQLAPNFALRDAIAEYREKERLEREAEGAKISRLPQPAASSDASEAPEASKDASLVRTCAVYNPQREKDGSTLVHVSVLPPHGTKRTPVDICCVVDVSGSMDTEATVQNAEGKTERHGLTLLDIVKHAVVTIVDTLGPEDRLSLVTYSNNADRIFGLIEMDKAGKARAKAEVKKLHTLGSTNIWDGLREGMVRIELNQVS
jgi:Mg-chelatase subunit ChlD